MNKYGIEHFHIELLEETNNPEEREQFWIKAKDTYIYGYNATLGGDGKSFVDRKQIFDLWQQGLNCSQIAVKLNYDSGWISKILKNDFSIPEEEIQKRAKLIMTKCVKQLDKNHCTIMVYDSLANASKAMQEQGCTKCKIRTGAAHISEVCRGLRKTFAGFIWEFV